TLLRTNPTSSPLHYPSRQIHLFSLFPAFSRNSQNPTSSTLASDTHLAGGFAQAGHLVARADAPLVAGEDDWKRSFINLALPYR
ncbi:unnamed protein product, partial [Linum tenue]